MLFSKPVKGSVKPQAPASFSDQIITSSCAGARQPSQLVFPTSQLIPNDHRHNHDRTWQVAKAWSRMERSRFFPKAARERFALRDDKVALSLMRQITSPRMGLQKRWHLPSLFSDKTQPLTDAEEIYRISWICFKSAMRHWQSAKIISGDKELD